MEKVFYLKLVICWDNGDDNREAKLELPDWGCLPESVPDVVVHVHIVVTYLPP